MDDETGSSLGDTICNGQMNGSSRSTKTSPQNNLISDHKQILDLITPSLEEAQHSGPANKLLKQIKEDFEKCDPNLFCRILFRAMLPGFQAFDKASKYFTNLFDFFFQSLLWLDKEKDSDGKESNSMRVRSTILRCCVKNHSDERPGVRMAITELTGKLLDTIKVMDLDKKVIEKLKDMLLHRLKDKSTQVRVLSATALAHLQNNQDIFNCKVTEELIFHVRYDPNPEVRRSALKSLSFNERTKEFIVDKVRDESELVRLSAHNKISKNISMTLVTIDDREKIIQLGLTDKSIKVRKRADFLIEEWLRHCSQNVIEFLANLDMVTNPKVCVLALNTIFKETSTKYFDKVDKTLWEDNKLIPISKLDEEVAFYWKFVVKKFWTLPFCSEFLVPSIHDLCVYISNYIDLYEERFKESQGPSVLAQLLEILLISLNLSEEGGRREIIKLIENAFEFDYLTPNHVKILMALFYRVQTEGIDAAFFELIQNMLEKSRLNEEGPEKSKTCNAQQQASLSEAETRALKLEVANLIHERHKLIREKDKAIAETDFLKAHDLQGQIDKLANEADVLKAKMAVPDGMSTTQQYDSQVEEKRPSPSDYIPGALVIAFSAFVDHIQRKKPHSPTAQEFYETFITKSIVCEEEAVREWVIKCMGLIGLENETDAKKSMRFCLQALELDEERIQLAAYKAMFDLVTHFGFNHFEENGDIQKCVKDNKNCINLSSSILESPDPSLKVLMMDKLNSDNPDLVKIGAMGVMKLSLANRFISAKLIVRLLVMWLNPAYDGNQLVRDIEYWLPVFVRMGSHQALMIADAFVPTLRKLVYAGRESPLRDASPEKLFGFVLSNTSPDSLERYMDNAVEIHERIAMNVLEQMAYLGPCAELPIFAKSFKFLTLRGLNGVGLEKILKKVARLIKMRHNKGVTQSLNAFLKYLNGELLRVEDKQVGPDDTASTAESTDSEESVHISNASSTEEVGGGDSVEEG